MVYNAQTWTDGPEGGTPISAVRLTYMEDGIQKSLQVPDSIVAGDILKKTNDGWEAVPAANYLSVAGVIIKGSSTHVDLLPATAEDGDAWVVNEQLYIWVVDAWKNVGNLKTVQGPPGDTGPVGPPGPGLQVLGSVALVGDLPSDADVGEAYFVGSDLHVWDGTDWNDLGPIAIASHGALTGLDNDDHTQYALVEGGRKLTVSSTTPVDPDAFDIWFDTNTPRIIKAYIGAEWSPIAGPTNSARYLQGNIADLPIVTADLSGTFYWATDDMVILYCNGTSWVNLYEGVSHTDLLDLESDDHTQYYNEERGDERYAQLSGTDFTGNISTPNIRHSVSSSMASSGLAVINFASAKYQMQPVLTGDIVYSTSNKVPGSKVIVRVQNGSFERSVQFPANWAFMGVRPTTILPNKVALLKVTSFGSTDALCVAEWQSSQ